MPTAAEQYGKPGDTAASATWVEKLDLVPAFLSVFGTICWRMIEGPFRGERGSDTYKHHVTNAAIRKLGKRLTTPQFQYITPVMRTVYEQWCTANSQEPNVVTLESGTEAYWVGPSAARHVVLYFHGGGFSLDGSPDHLDFWGGDVMAHVNKERPDSVAFLFLAYTLVPYATYPTQICEAIEALSYILEQLGKAPSNVSLGGDSAGGNLCIAVLSHLLHPSPDLPSLKTSGPLKLMLLLGPWTSFRMDFPSCESNSDRDITTTRAEIMWSSTYLAESASTPYAEPHSAEPGWWRGAENRVEHIICTAGSDEILVDSITQWVEKYTSVTPKGHLRYVVGHREIHTAPIMRLLFKDSPPTQQGEAIKAFLLARL